MTIYSSNENGYGFDELSEPFSTEILDDIEETIENFLEALLDIELDEDNNLVIHWPDKDEEIRYQLEDIKEKFKRFKETI